MARIYTGWQKKAAAEKLTEATDTFLRAFRNATTIMGTARETRMLSANMIEDIVTDLLIDSGLVDEETLDARR